jgi:hypothetical protein
VPPACEKPVCERLRGFEGIITQELYDPGQVADGRLLLVIFPFANGKLVHL